MTNQFKSSIISVATTFWPYIFFPLANNKSTRLSSLDLKGFELLFDFFLQFHLWQAELMMAVSKYWTSFQVSPSQRTLFFFLMKFSNLESLSFEDFLLWKSAPVKFRKELSLPLRKQVILLPTKLEISLLWLSHRKIKIALTNLRIIRCKKNPLYPFFLNRHTII